MTATKTGLIKNNGVAIILVVLLLLTTVGFFVSRAGLDKELVDKRLTEWSDIVAEKAAAKGYKFQFTHGEVSVEGGLFSRKAVSPKIVARFTSDAGNGEDSGWEIATDVVEILPKSASLQALSVHFTAPVNIRGDHRYRIEYTPELAIDLFSADNANDNSKSIGFRADIPSSVVMTYINRDGTELPVKISSGKGSYSKGAIDSSKLIITKETLINNPKIEGFGLVLTAQSIKGTRNVLYEDHNIAVTYDVAGNKMNLSAPWNVFGDFNGNLKLGLEAPLGVLPNGAIAENHFNLEKFTLKTPKSSIEAQGNIRTTSDELVPVGTASLKLNGVNDLFSKLREAKAVTEMQEGLIRSLLSKVASVTATSGDSAVVSLERQPGAAFYVGDLPFEELMAQMLGEILKSKVDTVKAPIISDKPVSDKPAADKKATETKKSAESKKSEPVAQKKDLNKADVKKSEPKVEAVKK